MNICLLLSVAGLNCKVDTQTFFNHRITLALAHNLGIRTDVLQKFSAFQVDFLLFQFQSFARTSFAGNFDFYQMAPKLSRPYQTFLF